MSMINMLNYLCYCHKLSSGNGILIKNNHQSLICGYITKSVIAAYSEVIQHLQWNMDDDLPPCETTACLSWFPRLYLDVLWLWESFIMPRSWLLDGFSTIRPHYSSLALSCLSPHPHNMLTHTFIHILPLLRMDRWTVAHAHTNTHIQYTNTNTTATSAPLSNTPLQCQMANSGGWEFLETVVW